MAGQKTIPSKTVKKQAARVRTKLKETPHSGLVASILSNQKLTIAIIVGITLLAFLPVLGADFVNWDDGDYYDNNFINNLFNPEIFTRTVQGNYHPLTMFSLAINFAISGKNAWSYHLFNLLFHLVNCALVFRLVYLLSDKNNFIAFVTAILFGIHPVHVESVAWVSERKDVLYGLFFLLGLISYVKYVDEQSKKHYALSMIFMLLSLLSKPAAVIFPLVLFTIDYLRSRKFNFRIVLEKAPFFLFALALGLATYFFQKKAGAVGVLGYETGQKLLFPFYGVMTYVFKAFLPFNLSPFYELPTIGVDLPAEYYIAPLFCLLLGVLLYFAIKRNRIIAFGILFFLVNLLLVIQIVSVGSAIVADRYTYIPYIGLFFIAAWALDRYARKNSSALVIGITAILAFLTFNQTLVWHNGASLWDKALKVAPSARAYNNRGNLYVKNNDWASALECFNNAISLNARDDEAHGARGNVYFNTGKVDEAIKDYHVSLAIKDKSAMTWDNLGVAFLSKQMYDSAFRCFNKALSIDSGFNPSYRNRGYTYMMFSDYKNALQDFNKFFTYVQDNPEIYNFAGTCYRQLGNPQESVKSITKAISIEQRAEFYVNRANSYKLFDIEAAKKDVLTAKNKGYTIPADLLKAVGM
jgi:tetratricopeptide (TPR) repeat protein